MKNVNLVSSYLAKYDLVIPAKLYQHSWSHNCRYQLKQTGRWPSQTSPSSHTVTIWSDWPSCLPPCITCTSHCCLTNSNQWIIFEYLLLMLNVLTLRLLTFSHCLDSQFALNVNNWTWLRWCEVTVGSNIINQINTEDWWVEIWVASRHVINETLMIISTLVVGWDI